MVFVCHNYNYCLTSQVSLSGGSFILIQYRPIRPLLLVRTQTYIKVAIAPALCLHMCNGYLSIQQCLLLYSDSSYDRVPDSEHNSTVVPALTDCWTNLLHCLATTLLYLVLLIL